MIDIDIEQYVAGMLGSPLGCLFLLEMDELGLPLEQATSHQICFWVAAGAINIIEKYDPAHEAIVEEVMERGRKMAPLARRILDFPGASWWFDPPDLERQLWIAHEGLPPYPAAWQRPSAIPRRWERYAQKPIGLQHTSTLYEGWSSMLIAYDGGAGDYYTEFPLQCWELKIQSEVTVYEVYGPESWHELCLRYPARGQDGSGRDESRLVPDWGAAAADLDGVHLTFGGLLACEQNRHEGLGEWSMHEAWHAEQTYWLKSLTAAARRLPDHPRASPPDAVRNSGVEIEAYMRRPMLSLNDSVEGLSPADLEASVQLTPEEIEQIRAELGQEPDE